MQDIGLQYDRTQDGSGDTSRTSGCRTTIRRTAGRRAQNDVVCSDVVRTQADDVSNDAAEDAGQSDENWTEVGRTDARRTSEGCSDGSVVACTAATAMALQCCDVATHDATAL
jgi:hypothetical protein